MHSRDESQAVEKGFFSLRRFYGRFALALAVFLAAPVSLHAKPAHGIAMHGSPKYTAGFTLYAYTNPDAPKGGRVNYASSGSFDSLNPLIVKGVAAQKLRGFVFESLMSRAYDEPFSLYGLIAKSIETPENRAWVTFRLNPKAKFSDGTPVRVEDVIFSWETLRDQGRPNHRFYYSKVERVERPGPGMVKFVFKDSEDREMPLIMGLMPVLPEHRYKGGAFALSDLKIPLGSGPYRVRDVRPGTSITYERNPDYWGRDLPVNKGRFNFDTVRIEYYRDANSMFEAFKKGLYDMRREGDPTRWALGYDFPAVRKGLVVRQEIAAGTPSGMAAFVFNTRRKVFADIKVRRALAMMFDFEWVNKHLFHGLYTRTMSFFERSELSSHGRPASARERELLEPWREYVLPEIMNGTFAFAKSDGSGRNRKIMRKAMGLLRAAGYSIKDGKMRRKADGKALEFEFLALTGAQERLALNFKKSLERIGVSMKVRQIDSAQYQRRRQDYDFDMIQNRWFASLSPGNEQSFRWSAKAAGTRGSFNYAGVENAAVDAMIKAMLKATSREDFVDAVHALDRVLLSGYYVIPLFHKKYQWYASWKRITRPQEVSLYGNRPDTWWFVGDNK